MSSLKTYTYCCDKNICKGLLVNNGMTTSYAWAIEHNCGICGSRVYICKLCNEGMHESVRKNKNRFDRQRLSRHHNIKHKVVIPEHNKSNGLDTGEPYTHNILDAGTVNNSDNLGMIPYDDKKVVYDRIESKNYFGIHESSTKSHRGPAYLVGMAVCQTSTAHKLLNDYDILLHLLITKFAASLTRGQKVEFGFILFDPIGIQKRVDCFQSVHSESR